MAVTTYHYDNLRSGWNHDEERLKPKNVASPRFQLRSQVPLDDQVDTQPLIVPHVKITAGSSPGEHQVVYVATEGNTIYAIDASNGNVLLSPNFGPPVPTPLGCGNNGPNVGINGTPVIDREARTMYVIVYTLEAGNPVYLIGRERSKRAGFPAQEPSSGHIRRKVTEAAKAGIDVAIRQEQPRALALRPARFTRTSWPGWNIASGQRYSRCEQLNASRLR